ncbi:MAG: hypothetical protein JW929_13150, partial [Anaerolineales bacterium]|nr:hypothetical protein [Anaerolineales bacterium]
MRNLKNELAYDVKFLKGHTLQPAWWKVAKIFVLLGAIAGIVLLFGWRRAAVFAVLFFLLMLFVHLVYRAGTRKFTRNWLDFVVVADPEKDRRPGIGVCYYASILLNALIA